MKIFMEGTKTISDIDLVERVKSGDQSAFTQLVDRYSTPVFRFSYSFLQDAEKAEDITQETFMVLWEKPELWRPSGQLKSWLFRIARNKSLDEIRARKPNIEIEKTDLKDEQKSPAETLFDQQLTTILDHQIQFLPERQREAITLVHFLECSNIEAAETMEISVDALESLLARGRRKLRALMEAYKSQYFWEKHDG